MKVLTAAQMRHLDARTMEAGISGPILMENAGHRVVEFLAERFGPLGRQRIVVLCGKGNNGSDGFVIARQLLTRFQPQALHVVSYAEGSEPSKMWEACGGRTERDITPEMQRATLVIDAVLGTGLQGPAHGPALQFIQAINNGFPEAKVVAVDLPSGMNSDGGDSEGEVARADATVTFTAPRVAHVLSPNCQRLGEFQVSPIGTPPAWLAEEHYWLSLTTPALLQPMFRPRAAESNKGMYGHVLVVGGAHGKFGAPTMSGAAGLRIGAGLVTVAAEGLASPPPELMSMPLPRTFEALQKAADKKLVAIGPGLGDDPDLVEMTRTAFRELAGPMVVDADGLNALAGTTFHGDGKVRILTPHPGEMSRLAGVSTRAVQADRLTLARRFAQERGVTLVLKGNRTLIATPEGEVRVNPAGSPALAKGGTGDILTGMVAGLVAQHPEQAALATAAAVYLHGRAGEIGAAHWTDRCLLATEILNYLPEAIRELSH